jgi:hypothetical protein
MCMLCYQQKFSRSPYAVIRPVIDNSKVDLRFVASLLLSFYIINVHLLYIYRQNWSVDKDNAYISLRWYDFSVISRSPTQDQESDSHTCKMQGIASAVEYLKYLNK